MTFAQIPHREHKVVESDWWRTEGDPWGLLDRTKRQLEEGRARDGESYLHAVTEARLGLRSLRGVTRSCCVPVAIPLLWWDGHTGACCQHELGCA